MKIEIDDSLTPKIDVDEKEAMELLAIALYKYKGIHGSLAGKLIGKTEGSLWIPDWLEYFAQIRLLRKPERNRITCCYN